MLKLTLQTDSGIQETIINISINELSGLFDRLKKAFKTKTIELIDFKEIV